MPDESGTILTHASTYSELTTVGALSVGSLVTGFGPATIDNGLTSSGATFLTYKYNYTYSRYVTYSRIAYDPAQHSKPQDPRGRRTSSTSASAVNVPAALIGAVPVVVIPPVSAVLIAPNPVAMEPVPSSPTVSRFTIVVSSVVARTLVTPPLGS